MAKAAVELADLIYEFLTFIKHAPPETQRNFAKSAKEMGADMEQFYAMSLSQLITERFRVTRRKA